VSTAVPFSAIEAVFGSESKLAGSEHEVFSAVSALTRRNPRSDFFLSIQVSYPNDADVRKARRNGWDTGGSIMIHGLPNQLKHTPGYYEKSDWTDGCIAVSNSDMLEIWLLTNNNTPIEILP